GAGANVYPICAAKTGQALAIAAQFRLSCRDPRPHSLPVVGEDFIPSAHPLCAAGIGAFSMALQEVPPVVAIVRETVRFPAENLSTVNLFLIAVDNLP